MKLKTIALSLGAFTCIAMANAPAFAVDGKVHPGSMCKGRFASSYDSFDLSNGVLKNIGSGYQWVICPVVRDNVTNTNGISSAKIVVHNVNSNAYTFCALKSYSPSGSLIEQETSSVWKNPGHYTWDLDLDYSADRGYYFFECLLTPNSRVSSYSVNEF